jgi:hypothetical protein
MRGEACPYAVLTAAIVRRIRKLHVPGRFGAGKIARALAADGIVVKPKTVDSVIAGVTWGHVK